MNDTDITRMAIEEIVRELEGNKLKELERQQERKTNPLGRPNKQFLGRTINSMLTHNKREDIRKQQNCRRKLKELDRRARHKHNNVRRESTRYRDQSPVSPYRVDDSCSSDSSPRSSAKHRTKKRRRHHRTTPDRSTPPQQQQQPDCDNAATTEVEPQQLYSDTYEQHYYHSYNYLHSLAANTACMTMAMTHMQGQLTQYQSIMEAANGAGTSALPTKESPSLSISVSSSSLSLCDDNEPRKMLTIDVASDSELDSSFGTSSSDDSEEHKHKEVPCISVDSDSNHSDSVKDHVVVNLETDSDCDDNNESNPPGEQECTIDLTED